MVQWRGGKPPATAPIKGPPLFKIYGLQVLLLFVLAAGLLLIDLLTAKSALIGGLISVLPNAYFARLAFRHRGARAAAAVAQSFYRGEAGKFVMTAILFALVFSTVQPLRAEVLLIAFVAMTLINTFFAWQLSNQRATQAR
ncbi:MAG: ATP synthase protein I [Bermanella sp.]|jgi:ATP synthase protein I